MNILEQIAEKTAVRVKEAKEIKPLETVINEAKNAPIKDFELSKSIQSFKQKGEMAFICEVKKASPSKGLIAEEFDYINIAKDYEKAGAAGISVLTEPYWFKGKNEYLTEISNTVKTPILRKDFTIDEYQIYTAKAIGASAVLLIAALLDIDTLKHFIEVANSLGLDSLVETHTENEVKTALEAGAEVLGINNRNLKTFEVDLETTENLIKLVPQDITIISESGIKTDLDIEKLYNMGVSGVLIGETLMRSEDKAEMLNYLRGRIK